MNLAERDLNPPKHGNPLTGTALKKLLAELGNGWTLVDEHHLEKDYTFQDFASALAFANRVGVLADEVDHHPEICLTWGRATVTIWTHSVGGLSEADFVFAARADRLS